MVLHIKSVLLIRKQRKSLLRAIRLHTKMWSSTTENTIDEIIFDSTDIVGIATLNRPKVLNAINQFMTDKLQERLEEWETTKQFVIIKGAGEKAFCAGGDVSTATALDPSVNKRGKVFCRTEYILKNFIATYAVPYVALMNGITMGGGVGLSIHGKYRIATETTLFAMPETGIGLFPDVGASYFLPRLQGKVGLYLGLTGHQLKGGDVLKVGIATHFIESSKLPKLYEELTNSSTTAENLDSVITRHTDPMQSHPFSLEPILCKIDNCFSARSVEEIVERLEKDKSEWATNTLEILKTRSPLSLKIAKRAYDLGSEQSLQDCFKMENRLFQAAVEARVSRDFYEGVRAQFVDKDRNPKWNPKTLEEVSEETVRKCFEPSKNIEDEITYLRSHKP